MGDSITEVRVDEDHTQQQRLLTRVSPFPPQGTVVAFLKQEGEYAAADEVVVQIETDKVWRGPQTLQRHTSSASV